MVGKTTLLVVDDEEAFRQLTARELGRSGYQVDAAENIAEARRLLADRSYHLVLLDIRLPDGNGLDFLKEIKQNAPETEVLMLTAHGSMNAAIQAMRNGASDFLTKPCKLEEVEIFLDKANRKRNLERHNAALRHEIKRFKNPEGFIGSSEQIRNVASLIHRVADTEATVLVRGQSGVGKELVAEAVHRNSERAQGPFVVVDCAALHENLLQSELFGHEKGAFTGAVAMKRGLFEVADGGSIFLDEVAEMTPALQVKLLRVLESGTLRRVGGNSDIKVDVRVIAATNRDLEAMILEGTFRPDLYYRLNVFAIRIPPLCERKEDIQPLFEHFVRHSKIAAKRGVRIDPRAIELLVGYSWPGNVRELENVTERALILCDDGVIEPKHLPLEVRAPGHMNEPAFDHKLLTLHEIEQKYIQRVLEQSHGHRLRAATILGISERNLYRRLKSLEQTQHVS
jgi:DNA-binding NtrC family response regulator